MPILLDASGKEIRENDLYRWQNEKERLRSFAKQLLTNNNSNQVKHYPPDSNSDESCYSVYCVVIYPDGRVMDNFREHGGKVVAWHDFQYGFYLEPNNRNLLFSVKNHPYFPIKEKAVSFMVDFPEAKKKGSGGCWTAVGIAGVILALLRGCQ